MLPKYKDLVPKLYHEQAQGKDFPSWYIGYKGTGYSGVQDNYQCGNIEFWTKMRSQAPNVYIIDSSKGKTCFPYKDFKTVIELYGDRIK
jgi:hypothetical protein